MFPWHKKYVDAGFEMMPECNDGSEVINTLIKDCGDFVIEVYEYTNPCGGKTIVKVKARNSHFIKNPDSPYLDLKYYGLASLSFFATGTPVDEIESKSKALWNAVRDIKIPHF